MSEKTSRQLQAEKTKARILDAALDIMKEKNFDDISIQEICKKANASVGAFYHHFGSKAGIVVEAYLLSDAYFQKEVVGHINTDDCKQAIITYLCRQGGLAEEYGLDLIRNIYKAQVDYASEFFLSLDRLLPAGLLDIVNIGIASGQLQTEKTSLQVAEELLIISRGIIYNWVLEKAGYDLGERIRSIVGGYLCSM